MFGPFNRPRRDMLTFTNFLFVYVLGGVTFLPLVVLIVLCHSYLTFPVIESTNGERTSTGASGTKGGDGGDQKIELDSIPTELKQRTHEPDVAAGYFAVCREYVPGGVNGKPPERTTPAGSVVASESPSVYQSMYRSIFDRNKSQVPSIEGTKTGAKAAKRARNVFFVVLRWASIQVLLPFTANSPFATGTGTLCFMTMPNSSKSAMWYRWLTIM